MFCIRSRTFSAHKAASYGAIMMIHFLEKPFSAQVNWAHFPFTIHMMMRRVGCTVNMSGTTHGLSEGLDTF